MFYLYALFTFAVGVGSFYLGERRGKQFVALVVKAELEAASFEKTVGAVYQRIKLAIKKHL